MFNMFVWIPDFKVKERKPDKDLLFRGQVVEQLTHATGANTGYFDFSFIFSLNRSALDHSATAPSI